MKSSPHSAQLFVKVFTLLNDNIPITPITLSAITPQFAKMETTLSVPSKLIQHRKFKNLRCLNLVLLVGAVSQITLLSSNCFVIADQSIHSRKFKDTKYSVNVNFEGTNNSDVSILDA